MSLGWPNVVSLCRIALIAPFVGCLVWIDANSRLNLRHAAAALFGLMALGDFLDGYLARRLRQETTLGRFLDPLGDKLLISSAVVLLALVGVPETTGNGWYRLPWWVAAVLLCKDLLLLVGSVIVYRRTRLPLIAPRPFGKACTASAFAMILATLLVPDLPPAWQAMRTAAVAASVAAALAASADYVRLGLRLAAGRPV